MANRIVLVMVALLLLVQSAGFWAVRRALDEQVTREMQDTLQVGERVWQRLLHQSAERLREGAVVLAADFGFRSAIATGDQATIISTLDAPMRAPLLSRVEIMVA